MGSDEHQEITEDEKAQMHCWSSLALIHGFNHMATLAESLGEKTFFRMARDLAEKEARAAGIEIQITSDEVILSLPYARARVNFTAQDIELMRKCVGDWDSQHREFINLDRCREVESGCNCSALGGQHSLTCQAYGSTNP